MYPYSYVQQQYNQLRKMNCPRPFPVLPPPFWPLTGEVLFAPPAPAAPPPVLSPNVLASDGPVVVNYNITSYSAYYFILS